MVLLLSYDSSTFRGVVTFNSSFMKKISKKDIRAKVEKSLHDTLGQFDISKPSKKTEKFIKKTTKKLSGKIKNEVKKQVALVEKEHGKTKKNGVAKKEAAVELN